MRTLMATLFAVAAVTAAPIPKELKKVEDKVAILGKWEVVKANVNGTDVDRYDPQHVMTFRADGTLVFQYPDSPEQTATWELDTTATPKKLTMTFTGAGKMEETYQFRDGRMVLAWRTVGRGMPAGVEPGPNLNVIEYKRAESK